MWSNESYLQYKKNHSSTFLFRSNFVINKNQITEKSKMSFKSQNRLSRIFSFMDKVLNKLTPGFVHKFQCGLYNETYYGETVRLLVIRRGRRIALSALAK